MPFSLFLALKYLMPIACGGVWTALVLAFGALMPESFRKADGMKVS